ncbi:MAG: homoserine dehydrogenase [Candidatus Omnitrophica bacterium]|nr:homoserine dehydrogenase [Candidatus Omnitrophota bacterium]
MAALEKVNIGIIGLGTVGSGVAKVLLSRREFLAKRSGVELVLKKVAVRRRQKSRLVRVDSRLLTTDARAVTDDPNIQIVVELMGGIQPAKDLVLRALKNRKQVVTANKALLSHEGARVFQAATKAGSDLYFEASVAGGIPIIKALREGLIGNDLEVLYGILNGTTNFILTEMARGDGRSFRAALEEAQARGYAEKNPSLDLKGIDTAHKLSILTLLGFGRAIHPTDIYVEGIQEITANDVRYAHDFGYTIKLLGIAKREGDQLEVRVHPTLLPSNHLLSSVNGVYNAVFVKGDLIGDMVLYGPGAGRFPTASAVIADIVDVARNLRYGSRQRVAVPLPTSRIRRVRRIGEIEGRYYFRFSCIDRPGVLARISRVLGAHRISIASVVQKDRRREHIVPVIMLTHEARERDVHEAMKEIDKMSLIRRKSVCIRVERG